MLGLVAIAACGARNTLPGTLAIEDDTTTTGSVGPNGSGGPSSSAANGNAVVSAANASAVSGVGGAPVTGVSAVNGISSGGVTTGFIPPGAGGTGVGAAPACPDDGNTGEFAGAAGEGGAPSEPEECLLRQCNGWVHQDGNCAGIQGSFFTYSDQENGGSSYIVASTQTDQICVLGYVNQVFDGQYDVYWGAGFGMNLNQAGFNYPPEPYDADAHGVTGFGFSVDALPIEGELRFMVRGDDFYCETVLNAGYAEYSLDDLVKGCWDPVSTPHDYSSLTSIEWHLVSNASDAYNFDLCITQLTVYRKPNE